jgi:hypothetical protein
LLGLAADLPPDAPTVRTEAKRHSAHVLAARGI